MRSRSNVVTAAAVVVSLATAGTAAYGTSAPSAPASPTVTVASRLPFVASYMCADPTLRLANASCGWATVPLDHAKPNGAKLKIGIAILLATAPVDKRQGMLVVNPGGPGASGAALAAEVAHLLPAAVAATYDIVGFDPRGVRTSEPHLSCVPTFAQGPRPDYRPTTGAGGAISGTEKAWLARVEHYAAACRKKYPTQLAHMSSLDVVKDIDVLRRGLGQDKINFYGFSYGSYLAQLYATVFPTHTRRMVLDSITDPRGIWYGDTVGRAPYMEHTISLFWAWVARNNKTYGLGTRAATVEARYYKEMKVLRGKPRGRLGPAEWNDAFIRAGYGRPAWRVVAAAFKAYVKGDPAPMTAVWESHAGVKEDNFGAVYLSVTCTDASWTTSYQALRKAAFALEKTAPFDVWHTLWGTSAACISWQSKPHTPVTINGTKAPALLLLSSTIDPATPYPGAIEVRKRFPRSRLVAELESPRHGVSLAGNSCIDSFVFAYLKDGKLPPRRKGASADVLCSTFPDPKP